MGWSSLMFHSTLIIEPILAAQIQICIYDSISNKNQKTSKNVIGADFNH